MTTALFCTWSENEDGAWETDCAESFVVSDGSPAENGMKYCCYCGRQLIAVPFVANEEDEEDDDI